MTLEQLEFLVAIQREGTISAAAQSLNISHPSISRSISNLEDELGVNLFIRSRSGTVITEQGTLILQSAKKILKEVENLRLIAGMESATRELLVKAFPLDSMFFVPEVISQLKEKHIRLTLNLSHANLSDILTDLKAQKIDFGLIALPRRERHLLGGDLKYRTLFKSRLMIACCGTSPLCNREILSIDELKNYPFVLHNDPIIINCIKDIFQNAVFPNVLTYANDNALIKQLVIDDKALSIYTQQLGWRDPYVLSKQIKLLPFQCSDDRDCVDFLCVYNGKKQLSRAEQDLLHLLTECTRQQN